MSTTEKDAVCEMLVDPESATSIKRNGKTFYFCSDHCRDKYIGLSDASETNTGHDDDRQEHACCDEKSGHQREGSRDGDQRIYTCPMHPEIEQVGPGSCPKCGMDLEPKTVSLDEEDDGSVADMTRRFWLGVVLSLPRLAHALLAAVAAACGALGKVGQIILERHIQTCVPDATQKGNKRQRHDKLDELQMML